MSDPLSCRSDEANPENSGHRFVRPELDLGHPPHYRGDQPSPSQIAAFLAGTPRYEQPKKEVPSP